MKLRKSFRCVALALSCVLASGGCSKAVLDGLGSGVTSGLSSAVSSLVAGIGDSLTITNDDT